MQKSRYFINKIKSIFLLFIIPIALFAQETGARYLIITHDSYYDALIPFAEWKRMKGLKTKIVTTAEIGSSSTEIRDYVVNAYNTWEITPEYLLLVGNKYQLPFPRMTQYSTICYSDNYYTNVTGDFHNEIIPGRFWVYDTFQIKTIVAKVLGYEKNPFLQNQLWFRKGVTIVNEYEQGQPPSDSVYWADARYMHALMNDAGFVHIDSLAYSFDNSSLDVVNAINDGCSYILYRGIGFNDWLWPFDGIYPDQMNNGFKLPIIISATCATIEGIGYEWMNAGTPEEPKGVVGFFGTTTGLFEAAEMRSTLTIGTLESIFCDSLSTLGKAAESGRLKYYELFGNTLEYDSWNCLGDPEMTVWTTTPKLIQVLHNPELYTKICTIYVNVQYNSTPVESALVCVMAKQASIIYHYGRTNNSGDIEFIGDFHVPGDSVFITVTGRNLKPYCGLIMVNFFGGPYVLLYSFSISDTPGGNGDLIANPSEDIEIPVWVKNWGDSTAYNVSATIHKAHTDPFFTLNDTIKYFGDIAPLDSTYTSDNGYNVIIAPDCPDTHQIALQLVINDANDFTWISDLGFTVHAPIILFTNYHFPGYLKYTPAGDTNQLIVELENIGSYNTENVIGKIWSDDSFFLAIDSISSFGTIVSGGNGSNQSDPFIIYAAPQTPPCYPVDVKIEVISGVYIDTLNFTIYVGQKDYLIWDPDLNHSSGPIIKEKLDALNFYGDYTITEPPYDLLSLYKSLFICLGIWSHNYIIRDTSQAGQEIEQYLELLGGKVYLEGGDVWYADPHNFHGYFFHPLFHIDPISTSVGPLSNVSGIDGTFTQSMSFNYSGENSSIDRIDPDNDGVLIFKKSSNDFGCGVAANNKTVGISFEFSGLEDSLPPSTKLILIDSIMEYFGIPPTGIKEYNQIIDDQKITFVITPNPFRQMITLKLQIPRTKAQITLKIYDVSGRLVKDFSRITPNAVRPTLISWDATDDNGRRVAQGVYFVRLVVDSIYETESFKKTEKIIFLK